MQKIIAIISVTLSMLLFFPQGYTGAEALSDRVSGHIRHRLEMGETSSPPVHEKSLHFESTRLPDFYGERGFRPAWSIDNHLSPLIEPFLSTLHRSGCEGLRPEDYRLHQIQAMISEIHGNLIREVPMDSAALADLDILLTDAFFMYVSHLVSGRIDHRVVYPGWAIYTEAPDMTEILRQALESGEIDAFLTKLTPSHFRYVKLKESLISYRGIAKRGGWPLIPPGAKMGRGSRDSRVSVLRQRLMVSGDLPLSAESESRIFDLPLENAVQKFQKRHGLKADGRVGRSTLMALNIPVETRIRQIALNMDRLRWLPGDTGRRYIFVNVADFSLQVIEDEQVVMSMKIIVGKTEQKSCVLSRKMTYLELNPFWRIPDSIATKEILPHVKKDPEYLAKNHIKVFWDWGDRSKEIDPGSVDWSRIKARHFKYKLRQEPGTLNPLGRIKFMFPNECEIYLHDTPARHLFGRTRRDFSHGCIRIEKPIDLAAYLLQNKDSWTQKKILAEIRKGKRQMIMLPHPIDVHIFYGTAWVDQNGSLQFRDDIYRIDEVPYEIGDCRNRLDRR